MMRHTMWYDTVGVQLRYVHVHSEADDSTNETENQCAKHENMKRKLIRNYESIKGPKVWYTVRKNTRNLWRKNQWTKGQNTRPGSARLWNYLWLFNAAPRPNHTFDISFTPRRRSSFVDFALVTYSWRKSTGAALGRPGRWRRWWSRDGHLACSGRWSVMDSALLSS